MDQGLIQVLVIAFFVIISMMDGVARKKRQEQQREAEAGDGSDQDFGTRDHYSRLPGGDSEEETTTSEGMVPEELWEEIAALARGEPSPSARRTPSGQLPPGADLEPESTDPFGAEETRLDPVHQHVEDHDHVEWEDIPSYDDLSPFDQEPGEALTRFDPIVPAPATIGALEQASEDLPAVVADARQRMQANVSGGDARRALRLQGRASLRQAMVLSEVLGPPAALRAPTHQPPGEVRRER